MINEISSNFPRCLICNLSYAINTLRPRQNDHQFADKILEVIFLCVQIFIFRFQSDWNLFLGVQLSQDSTVVVCHSFLSCNSKCNLQIHFELGTLITEYASNTIRCSKENYSIKFDRNLFFWKHNKKYEYTFQFIQCHYDNQVQSGAWQSNLLSCLIS